MHSGFRLHVSHVFAVRRHANVCHIARVGEFAQGDFFERNTRRSGDHFVNAEAGSEYEQWRLPKGTPDVPCPVVADGLVYLSGEGGSLACIDAKTGKVHYEKALRNFRHRASPVVADGKVYLTARDATVYVVKAGPTFELLATNKLPDEMTASPMVSGGRIYLRGFKNLYAIGMK